MREKRCVMSANKRREDEEEEEGEERNESDLG